MSRPSVVRAVFIVAVLASPWWYGSAQDPARYGLTALILLVAGAWLWGQPSAGPLVAPAGALASWTLLQSLRGPVLLSLESAVVLCASLATAAFWATQAREEANARRLAYVVLAVCAAQGAFGVVQSALAPRALYGRVSPDVASPFGSYHNHNHFAGLIEMGAVLAAALALGKAKRAGGIEPWSIGFAGLGLALAGAHLASRSRGGLLALIAGAIALALLWLLAISKRRPTATHEMLAALMLVAFLGFGWLAVPAATRAHLATSFRGATDASGNYRLSIGGASLQLWWANPIFGCGLGTYAEEVTRFKRSDGLIRAGHAESDALEFLAEAGIVGVALLGWLGVAVAGGFLDRLREGRDPWRKSLAVGAMAAVIAHLVHSFFDFNLRIPSNALVFSALLGLAGAPRTEPPPASGLLRRLLAGVFLVMAALAAWRAAGAFELQAAQQVMTPHDRLARMSEVLSRYPYLSEAWRERSHLRWALARGNREMETFRLRGAAEDMEQALRLRPHMSHAWADLGWLRYLQGDPAGAEQAFDRAAELDPAGVAVGLARAEFFARLSRADEAREELHRIRRYNPDWPEASAETTARRLGLGSLM